MKITRHTLPYLVIILFACLVLFFSFWDILYTEDWVLRVSVLYGILIVLILMTTVSQSRKKTTQVSPTVQEFEKTLEGQLHHFKCQNCNGIFAIKKSKHNNKKTFVLTCPDCGHMGTISSSPEIVVEQIPEKKSMSKTFRCQQCGEWVSIWAEGTELHPDIHIDSCPYCGAKQTMTAAR